MRDLGDRTEDSSVSFKFFTTDTGSAPITLAGTPVVSVYKDNGTTQSTAGVTLTVDFDSVTGMHDVTIDLSADAFYATGSDYSVVLTNGTVDSISVVGAVLATFSIQNRYLSAEDVWTYATRVLTANTNLAILDAAGIRTAIGMASANMDTQLGNLQTSVDGLPVEVTSAIFVDATWTGLTDDVTQLLSDLTAVSAAVTTLDDYVDTEVASIKTVTDKLNTALEDDGSSGWQYTTLAMENVSATVSGNVTVGDLTSAALAKFATVDTGETAAVDGSVAKISQGSGGGGAVVIPVGSVLLEREDADTINTYIGETTSVSITVYEADGTTAVDLSALTLEVIFERDNGTDVATIAGGSITISGASNNVATFSLPSAVTTYEWLVNYTLRKADGDKYVYANGHVNVRYAGRADS